jgi:hypothetical protein
MEANETKKQKIFTQKDFLLVKITNEIPTIIHGTAVVIFTKDPSEPLTNKKNKYLN